MKNRHTKHQRFIRTNPEIMGGEPVFVGTRVPVKSLFEHTSRLLSIIVLPTNHWPTLRENIAAIQTAIDHAEPGDYTELEF